MILKAGSVIVIAALFSVFLPNLVSATSSYDEVINTPTNWEVVDSNSTPHTTNPVQAIDNISNTQQKEACEAVYSKFMQMDYRVYDVSQPSRYDTTKYARAFATDEAPGQTQWSTAGQTKSAYALWHNYVSFQLKYENNKVVAFDCADNTDDQYVNYTYALTWDDGFTGLQAHHTEGFQLAYPSGYEGDSVPSGSIDKLITGNVQCANTNNIISAVSVNAQTGMDGNAKITNDGVGGKNYRFYLSEESPYSLTVLCDGDPFYSPTVDVDLYYNYNWVCTPAGDLNVCAAS